MHMQPGNSYERNDGSNHDLWRGLQKGDRQAFSELFSRFYSRLFRYGIKLVSNKEAVQDGIQELFLSLWRNRGGLGDANSVEFYLLFSLRRILFKEKKSTHARQKRNREYKENASPPRLNIEDQIIRIEQKEERYRLYQKALETLTDRQKEALRLRMEYGLNNSEIAEIMVLSEKRIRNLIYEATKRLREQIARFEAVQVNIN